MEFAYNGNITVPDPVYAEAEEGINPQMQVLALVVEVLSAVMGVMGATLQQLLTMAVLESLMVL